MTISIGTVSYTVAAAAFLFFSVLLLTSWRGRLQGMLLAAASLETALWAGAQAYLAMDPDVAMPAGEVLEVLRSAVWFAFLIVLLGYSRKAVRTLRLATACLAAFCGIILVATLYQGITLSAWPGMFTVVSRLMLAVIGMVLVELLFREVHPQQRWGIKFLCIGLGG